MRFPIPLLVLALAACAYEPAPLPATSALPPPSDAPPPPALPSDSTALGLDTLTAPDRDATAEGEWTTGIVEGGRLPTPSATLRAVRTGAHEAFVRTVFEFDGRVPDYHLEYVDKPVYHCGSGEAQYLAGDAWLEVRFQIAVAHTEAGEVTVAERDRRLDGPLLRQLTLTCDFEGHVTWVLGLAAPNPYRVTVLDGPPRLVVDVQR